MKHLLILCLGSVCLYAMSDEVVQLQQDLCQLEAGIRTNVETIERVYAACHAADQDPLSLSPRGLKAYISRHRQTCHDALHQALQRAGRVTDATRGLLHIVASYGTPAQAALLLGQDPNYLHQCDSRGGLPVDEAAVRDRIEMVIYLVLCGAKRSAHYQAEVESIVRTTMIHTDRNETDVSKEAKWRAQQIFSALHDPEAYRHSIPDIVGKLRALEAGTTYALMTRAHSSMP